jgi:hypothetical protein
MAEKVEYIDPYTISSKQWHKIISYLNAAIDTELEMADPIAAIKLARILEQVALASTGDLLPKDWNEELLK